MRKTSIILYVLPCLNLLLIHCSPVDLKGPVEFAQPYYLNQDLMSEVRSFWILSYLGKIQAPDCCHMSGIPLEKATHKFLVIASFDPTALKES